MNSLLDLALAGQLHRDRSSVTLTHLRLGATCSLRR